MCTISVDILAKRYFPYSEFIRLLDILVCLKLIANSSSEKGKENCLCFVIAAS